MDDLDGRRLRRGAHDRRVRRPPSGDLIQSEQDVRDPARLQLGYTRVVHGAACRAGGLEDVLLIGVGGGSLVRSLHPVAPGAHVDAVELHEPVLDLVRRWFGLPEGPWVDYHVDDGRRFLIWAAPAAVPIPGCQAEQAAMLGLSEEAVRGARLEIDAGRMLTDDRNPAGALSRD